MAWQVTGGGGDQRQALHLAFWSRQLRKPFSSWEHKRWVFFNHITIYPQHKWYRPLWGGGPPNTGMCSKWHVSGIYSQQNCPQRVIISSQQKGLLKTLHMEDDTSHHGPTNPNILPLASPNLSNITWNWMFVATCFLASWKVTYPLPAGRNGGIFRVDDFSELAIWWDMWLFPSKSCLLPLFLSSLCRGSVSGSRFTLLTDGIGAELVDGATWRVKLGAIIRNRDGKDGKMEIL